MGVLRDHDIGKLVPLGYNTFCETGTGYGTAVKHARQFPFASIYSCDCDAEQVARLADEFADDPRIRLFPMTSDLYLEALLSTPGEGVPPIIKPTDKVVWFLDSHFPGFDLHGAAIDAEKDLSIRLPLHSELETLVRYGRHTAGDVVIADDMRIYRRGSYEGGSMERAGYAHATCYDRPLPLSPWEKTHSVKWDMRDSGYLVMVPKAIA